MLENRKLLINFLVDLDGTKNINQDIFYLGANSILAVSLACARLATFILIYHFFHISEVLIIAYRLQ